VSIYDVDKLMSEARQLAANYRKATGKPLGISSEIAIHDVIRIMDLEIVETSTGGYDAIGKGTRAGKKIQIKGRTVSAEMKSNQRVGQLKVDQDWDSVMLVLLNEDYEPMEIYEAAHDNILEVVSHSNSNRRNRGAMSVSKFKHIAELVWTVEDGVVNNGIWENQS